MLTRGKPDPIQNPKRFYKDVSTAPAEGGGFFVMLDGRAVRTPAGAKLVLPTAALAELVASEWAAQGEFIVMADMPAMRLASTAADQVPGVRESMAEVLARYAATDLLCYFAVGPETLVERQIRHWDPVLDWARDALGLHLVRTVGIVHQPQPQATVERARDLALELDDFALAGLAHAAGLFGSAILAFALRRGELTGDAAFDLSRLDEAFQEELWGIDAEAAERTARLRAEAVMLERWFRSLLP